ncbi:hypothetical protein [Amnibacterium endophyticum]|uniref:DUF2029 domain-containing protein n=1 Tax=Amnibacterium endophyticum TaxID=2109337 RepID=A0ABW4LCB8_9MICO
MSAATSLLPGATPTPPRRRSFRPAFGVALPIAVGVLAFVVRIGFLLRGGGLTGIGSYDDGVYYSAADALVHGRVPYADFLLLHPPGIVLAAAPFAALGAVTNDTTGYVVARIAFELVGALNAALVVLILKRFGTTAAVVGGLLYAVLLPAAWVERSVLLEALGSLGILAALLLLRRERPSDARVLAAGLAAGAAADVKIWYVVPVLVIAVFGTDRRGRFLLGAAIAIVAVCLPFFALDPGAMFREVVLDQLGRPRDPAMLPRVAGMLGVQRLHGLPLRGIVEVAVVLAAAAAALALVTRGARVFALLLAADAAVLIASPSWFEHYGSLTAPPLALCAGVGAQRLLGLVPARYGARAALVALVGAAVVIGGTHIDARSRSGVAVPAAFVRAVQADDVCITTDDPSVLIVTDSLSRDLSMPRCPVWPDVTGWTYDPATLPAGDTVQPPRREDPAWQQLVLRFLRAGDATILVRRDTGLDRTSLAALHAAPPLARDGRWVLRPTT